MIQYVRYTHITCGKKRRYEDEPWGFRLGLVTHNYNEPDSVNYYTCDHEAVIAASMFFSAQQKGRSPNSQPAKTVEERKQVMDDQRVSAHFVNMSRSLLLNMSGENPILNVHTALDHCVFFTADQTLSMIAAAVSGINKHPYGSDLRKSLTNALNNMSYLCYTEFTPSNRRNWKSRLGPKLIQYVEGSESNSVLCSSDKTESEKIAASASGVSTNFNTSAFISLLKLVRNVYCHWGETDDIVKLEICGLGGYSADTLLSYFTLRYPMLVTLVWDFCSIHGIAPYVQRPVVRLQQEIERRGPKAKAQDPNAVAIIGSEHVTLIEAQEAAGVDDDWI